MQEITDPDLRLLIRRIKDKTDIDLGQYKDSYILRRLSSRMKIFGAATYRDYMGILEKDAGEYDKVVDAFTINVSEFFRDKEVFKVISGKVMPDLIAEKKRTGRRNIRIWSAGCACGEEVYSLSMILNDLLGKDYGSFSIRLFATDIDEAIMAKAKEGIYDPVSLKNVDNALMAKYTVKLPDGKIKVTDDVKRNVTFKNFDLIKGGKFGTFFDLILCRNVMIYFSDEQKAKLLMEFYNSLGTGGYLVIGRTETLVGDSRNVLQAINSMERVYRRPETGTTFEKPFGFK
jgi:chemotaxis protein methyltransferase CheR